MEQIIKTITTSKREQALDITDLIQNCALQLKKDQSLCHIFVPHTTAALTINEGYDPEVMDDMLRSLNQLIPQNDNYRHLEGNSAAHIKTSLLGNSLQIIISQGNLQLGRWQRIFFMEFDGPRTRNLMINFF